MSKPNAEELFRAAFYRLKSNTPLVLCKGSPLTQNNVAREAGCDPSALRKSRYPALIEEIQRWLAESGPVPEGSQTREKAKQRARNRSLRDEIKLLKAERDSATSLLLEADARILELFIENQRLKSMQPKSNVLPMKLE
ncbi:MULTISPECIES: hypothetical protein [Pseudomonas]|uniref:Uncharacterized protein n=2 Tax=Pseudomonas TaxID=286 RepID=A0A7W2QBI2_9PSED|nr:MULTISPECIES: hypothetical protein [Pseudomonas]MBA6100317.1 hypothetical protein [Pseudomonas juntendi]MBA6118285.1 hypothetical protein [Pseudomonas putida]